MITIRRKTKYLLLAIISSVCIMCKNNQASDMPEYNTDEIFISFDFVNDEIQTDLVYLKVVSVSIPDDTLDIICNPHDFYLDYVRCNPNCDQVQIKTFMSNFQKAVITEEPYIADSLLYRVMERRRLYKDEDICKLYAENGADYIFNTFVDENNWIYKINSGERRDSLKVNQAKTIIMLLQKHGYSAYIEYSGWESPSGYTIWKRK